MRRPSTLLILLALVLSIGSAFGQKGSIISEKVKAARSQGAKFPGFALFDRIGDPDPSMRGVLPKGSIMAMNRSILKGLKQASPKNMSLQLPGSDGQMMQVELIKNELFTSNFSVITPNGTAAYQKGVHYQGIINGNTRSLAAISIFDNEVVGVLDLEGSGNYILGAVEGDKSGRYAFFRSDDLQHDMKMDCQTLDAPKETSMQPTAPEMAGIADANKVVRIYYECEYDMFVSRSSSVQSTVDYMTGIYNVVKTLYDNDGVNTAISEIYVWTTPDTYPTTSTSDALTGFRNARANNFNGDVAHLVSQGAPSGGGVAWVDVLCNKSYSFAYSYIYPSYSTFPTYSWTVEVLTHEMGHNLGSRHTHNCSWDVNNDGVASEMIDGCGPKAGYTEGSCTAPPLPTNGGTIMSYCHLVSGVGINFNNGFGPLPGALIRNRVYNASCLTSVVTCATTISTSKTDVTGCFGNANGSITATGAGGTAPYTYLWSNNATTATISGLIAGTYTVTVKDQNGAGCAATASVTITQPAKLALSTSVTNETAPGSNNGTINLTVTGGTTPYTYLWSNTATSEDLSGMTAGTYSVTVTDKNGCTANTSATITSACVSITSSFPAAESFENATIWGAWKQGSGDNGNWTWGSTTPTAATGPDKAFDGTSFIYLEADGLANNAKINLETECVDLRGSTSANINFAYHMYGKQMGSLTLFASADNGVSWTQLWTMKGNKGNLWNSATVTLSNTYVGKIIKLRFVGVRGKGILSDLALDKVTINATGGALVDRTAATSNQKELVAVNTLEWRSIYPNPATNTAYLEVYSPGANTITMQLSDASGRLVSQLGKATLVTGRNVVPVDVSKQISGLYLITIQDGTRKMTKKIQVQ